MFQAPIKKELPKTNMELVEESKDCIIPTPDHQTYWIYPAPTKSHHPDDITCLGSGTKTKKNTPGMPLAYLGKGLTKL